MSRRIAAVLVGLVLALCPPAARADLPAEGWPQPRRDARRTGRSPQPALADPQVILTEAVGESLLGEPAALGCDVYLGNGGGDVLRVNARGAGRGWRASQLLPACGTAVPAPSSVAVDAEGQVLAGLAGDPGLSELLERLCQIVVACLSYAIDNNEYPPGVDLRAELAPIYIDPWPLNPCTGAEMAVTDVPSAGDVRYFRDPATQEFFIGGWWTDGGLVSVRTACAAGSFSGFADLHPSWPVSTVLGAGAVALDAEDGSVRWRPVRRGLSLSSSPALLPGAVAWAHGGIPGWAGGAGGGRLVVTSSDGTLRWFRGRFAGFVGGSARDEGGDVLFTAAAAAGSARLLDQLALSLATGAEMYSIDFNLYPPQEELQPHLVPTYLRGMPMNVLDGGPATWSLTPSPGNYFYETWNGRTEYRVGFWNAQGLPVSIVETGVLVQPGVDEPAMVEARAIADGALRWTSPLPAGVEPSPVMLTADGVIVAGTDGIVRCLDRADGRLLWSVPTGIGLTSAPAELPDGGLAFTHAGGVLVVDPGDRVRFTLPLPAGVSTAPAVTSDGVIYAGDLAGTLHAIRADGSTPWSRDCTASAAGPVSLTTTAIPHEGWIHVGRSDGRLVSLAERGETLWPVPLPGLLRAWRTRQPAEARLAWLDSPLGAALGEHYHLKVSADARGPWRNVLPHDFQATELVHPTPGLPLACYVLTNASCGELEPPP